MSDTTPSVSFSGRSRADADSFLAMGAPAKKQQAHGLRVRKIAEQMHITPGTSRLGLQTGQEKWVSAPDMPEADLLDDVAYEDAELGDEAATNEARPGGLNPVRTKWTINHKSLANDDFYEADPFQAAEDEDQYGQEVGEADVEEEWEEEAVEESVVPAQKIIESKRSAATGGKVLAEVTKVVAKPAAPKAVVNTKAPKADWELFKAVKFNEADMRDTGAKAVCRVKHLLRQPGSQADGRPCVPPDWDTRFKPVLGAFKRFILTRPDQFRIITGAEFGQYTVAIVPQKLVAPPEKGKGKKGKAKGKGKDGKDGKGKDGKGKGKFWDDGKGNWGKSWGKGKKGKDGKNGKDQGKVPFTGAQAWGSVVEAVEEPVETPKVAPPTRATKLLAAAARDALLEEEEAKEQEQEAEEEAAEDAAGDGEAQGEEDETMDWPADEEEEEEGVPDEDPIEKLYKPVPEASTGAVRKAESPEEDEDDFDSSSQHGRFISSLLTGLGGLGAKRPRLVA